MRTLFSTEGLSENIRFRRWREALSEQIAPLELRRLDDGRFSGTLEAARVGGMTLRRMSCGAVRNELTPSTIRRHDRGTLIFAVKLVGTAVMSQDDRVALHRPGDLMVLDTRPTVIESSANDLSFDIELPRESLERVLGSARQYSALTIDAAQGSTALAVAFLTKLVDVHQQLDVATAERMAGIGLDLVVASVAERLARDVPRSVYGNVLVQRAKAYVEANVGDPTLDPRRLAAAVGISLRQLQSLFHERGRHISEWIWERRLEAAARLLADPGHAHVSIGVLSYGCGFVNQAHFSKRFRDRFGVSPRQHRRAALLPST